MTKINKMTLKEIQDKLPDYAYDMNQNLNQVLTVEGAPGLTEKEIAAIAVAAAMATSSKELLVAIEGFGSTTLSEKEIEGAKIAHATMSMTNVYYRFLHICDNNEYKRMQPHLQMKAKSNPGISQKAFELAALGVSAINNCKACIDFHELALRRLGVSAKGIQSCIRIAAVINAVGEILKF